MSQIFSECEIIINNIGYESLFYNNERYTKIEQDFLDTINKDCMIYYKNKYDYSDNRMYATTDIDIINNKNYLIIISKYVLLNDEDDIMYFDKIIYDNSGIGMYYSDYID